MYTISPTGLEGCGLSELYEFDLALDELLLVDFLLELFEEL